MSLTTNREIPCNYTSADDVQIVTLLLGSSVWYAIQSLQYRKVTGRLLRLVYRFIGDLFMLHRNPFVVQELIDNSTRRRHFLKSARFDLDMVRRHMVGVPEGDLIIRACHDALQKLESRLAKADDTCRQIQQVIGAVIGIENVRFDPFSLISHATDATDWRVVLPIAILYPSKETEIPDLIQAISQLGLHAVPRGAGTGLTGGSIPAEDGCVIINLEKLNRIQGISHRSIKLADGSAKDIPVIKLESGVITEDAIQFAASRNLVFATDPTSAWACTIGGNIAENAGGKTAVLWGTAIDNILMYRMVMPDGRRVEIRRMNHPARKIQPGDWVEFEIVGPDGAVIDRIGLNAEDIRKPGLGKDITNKALGGLPGIQKEGCDGVITSAEFILYPAYPHKLTCCLEFFGEDMDEAGRVIVDISRNFENRGQEALMALEHFDEEYVKAIDYTVKAPIRQRPKAVLLIDIVGHTADEVMAGQNKLTHLLSFYSQTFLTIAKTREEGVRFWKDRKKLGAIARRTHAFKLNEDIVLPLDMLADFSAFVDNYNIEEDRYNQKTVVWQIAAAIDGNSELTRDAWMQQKQDEARKLCREIQDVLDLAGKTHLQEESHLKRLMDDLNLLFSGVPGMVAGLSAIQTDVRKRLIIIATHMHAGDGNVHVNIPVFSNDRDMMNRAAETADAIMAEAVSLGGVVSGEHGIGITKFKYLAPEKQAALSAYRDRVDPMRLMNPGKLENPDVPIRAFATSFNLLGIEAHILRYGSLETLAKGISGCVRCGKCKPNCCVFSPAENLFYHPRNKNLAITSLIEAVLYDAQRSHSARFGILHHLKEIADHCTICHKCLNPCPVHIDTGEITVMEREVLRAFSIKKPPILTRITLNYLESRSRMANRIFRKGGLDWGISIQRIGSRMLTAGLFPDRLLEFPLAAQLASPLPILPDGSLHDLLPPYGFQELIVLEPEKNATHTVFYFPGCGSERLHSTVSSSAIYLMLKNRIRVVLPPRFLCCGFPAWANAESGQHDRLVLRNTIIFNQIREMLGHMTFDACFVTCGTCQESLNHMDAAQIFGCPVVDAAGFLMADGLKSGAGKKRLYHIPCHDSLEGQGMQLLQQAEYRVDISSHCCSEAGTLAVSSPAIAHAMLRRKQKSLNQLMPGQRQPAIVLTNCPACLQGLGRLTGSLTVRHVCEDLALAIGGPEWQNELKIHLKNASVMRF
ncbi:MAG: DUF3683 domain-containing protein [Desulfatirhabdiaceae bacterium]